MVTAVTGQEVAVQVAAMLAIAGHDPARRWVLKRKLIAPWLRMVTCTWPSQQLHYHSPYASASCSTTKSAVSAVAPTAAQLLPAGLALRESLLVPLTLMVDPAGLLLLPV
jgi:hypothetical protein